MGVSWSAWCFWLYTQRCENIRALLNTLSIKRKRCRSTWLVCMTPFAIIKEIIPDMYLIYLCATLASQKSTHLCFRNDLLRLREGFRFAPAFLLCRLQRCRPSWVNSYLPRRGNILPTDPKFLWHWLHVGRNNQTLGLYLPSETPIHLIINLVKVPGATKAAKQKPKPKLDVTCSRV